MNLFGKLYSASFGIILSINQLNTNDALYAMIEKAFNNGVTNGILVFIIYKLMVFYDNKIKDIKDIYEAQATSVKAIYEERIRDLKDNIQRLEK